MVASSYLPGDEQEVIWVLLESNDGLLSDVSFELLAKGRALADEVDWQLTGVLLGSQVDKHITCLLEHQVDEVILVDHPRLSPFTVDAHSNAFHQAIIEIKQF